jgi:hypothetical protein
MRKFLFVFLCLFFTTTSSQAHSGRIDGSGGHRVNKEFVYEGRFIVINDGNKYYEFGKVVFGEGDYHFHVKPLKNGYLDGIYIPAKDKEVKKMRTDIIVRSPENVIGSKGSNLYHNPDSHHVSRMKLENIIIFEDKEDAETNGYSPSKNFKQHFPGIAE